MSYLADTNILSALVNKNHTQYAAVRRALKLSRAQKVEIYLVPQNVIEFWAIATRPVLANGLGLTANQTTTGILLFKRVFGFLDDEPGIFSQWENLVEKYQVSGKNVHDARIVAAMLKHGLSHLLTLKVKDFNRFKEIVVVDPISLGHQ